MTSRADTDKRQAAVADLAALLAAKLCGAGVDELTEQIADLHLTIPQARAVLDHLRAHPDALTSGHSGGPPGLERFLGALADTHPDVRRMRCSRCDAERRLPYRRAGTRICSRCYDSTLLKPCVRCGELGHPVFREGCGTVCRRCAAHDPARHDPCTGCGKSTRVAYRLDGKPYCQSCGPRKYYTCSMCGRGNQRALAVTADGPVCSRCYQRDRLLQCDTCGRTTRYARADDSQAGAWICYRCWTPPTMTCTDCGRERPCVRGITLDRPVCSTCHARRRPARTCARCSRIRQIQTTLPLGSVCGPCFRQLRRTPGSWASCHQIRPLVGHSSFGAPLCGPCTGDKRNWVCEHCGRVDLLLATGLCLPCSVTIGVDDLLTGPDGQIHPQLDNVRTLLLDGGTAGQVQRLLRCSRWLRLLGQLVSAGGVPISHADLDALPQSSDVRRLRGVLVRTDGLDDRDADLVSTQVWLDKILADLPAEIAALVRPYAAWSVLRRARHRATRIKLTPSAPRYARTRIRAATAFLTWLAEHDRKLSDATQADIDRWLVAGTPSRRRRDFIRWANSRHLTTDLHVPWLGREGLAEHLLDDEQRWALLRRCLHDETLPLRLRVAGALVLVYGHIPARIVELTADHLTADGTHILLDEQPVLLPPVLADLIARLREQRPARNSLQSVVMTPAWLFPGGLPGAHLSADRLAILLNTTAGIPVRAARGAALCALAADLSAPVLADLLGVSVAAATRWNAVAARDNAEYLAARNAYPPH